MDGGRKEAKGSVENIDFKENVKVIESEKNSK
jgi:predicted RNA-binding protein